MSATSRKLSWAGALARERLQHAHARDVLRERRRDGPERLAHRAIRASGALAEPCGGERHQRDHGERRKGEPPVEEEQQPRGAGKDQRVLHERGDAVSDELVERLDIVRQAADDHAGPISLVEPEREALQVLEHDPPQVGEHALAGPPRVVRLRVAQPHAQHANREEGADEQRQLRGVAVLDLVDRQPDE